MFVLVSDCDSLLLGINSLIFFCFFFVFCFGVLGIWVLRSENNKLFASEKLRKVLQVFFFLIFKTEKKKKFFFFNSN